MSFFRTPSGIANQAIFFQARFVVYVEEAPTIDAGRAVDAAFWRSFFVGAFDAAFHFKPLGGKRFVEDMAKQIIAGSVPNSFCALDADYDALFGRQIIDERVFYTFGYGVENELFSEQTLPKLIRYLVPGAELADAIGEDVWKKVLETLRLDWPCLVSDQVAASRDWSTIDRVKPQSCLNVDVTPIRFRRDRVASRITEGAGKATVRPFVVPPKATAQRAPAHTFFELVYHSIVSAISSITDVKFSKDWIRASALAMFTANFLDNFGGDARSHYEALSLRPIARFSSA